MLALTLTCALLMQQPEFSGWTPDWVTSGVDRDRPAATVVQGTAELDTAEAFESARAEAISRLRQRWEARAEKVVQEAAPAWLPAFVTERAVRDWMAHLEPDRALEVLDRADRERQHSFGPSYQTSLLVVEDPDLLRRAERRLGQQLARAQREFLTRAGGTLGLWAFLALGVFWLDRLSRGYMTGRLTLLATAIGAGVPVVLFLV